MYFYLTYDGPLPSNGNAQRKQDIRRAFHPQLKDLWASHAALQAGRWLDTHDVSCVLRTVGAFTFAPLICDKTFLLAKLDILLLRAGSPGSLIMHGGDIDNRLKTLFDGLRCATHLHEIPTSDSPQPGDTPFFTLLDGDERIVEANVRAERFLDPPTDPYQVRLIIKVETRAEKVTYGNQVLL
jgi:hypothetical protein